MAKELEMVQSSEELRPVLVNLQVFTSNNRSSKKASALIRKAIEKNKMVDDKKSRVILYDLQIRQLYHQANHLQKINNLLFSMRSLTEEINYQEGLALFYQLTWHIEKFQDNKKKSSEAINKSMKILNNLSEQDGYVYNFCRYSYAVERWLEKHDSTSADILEACAEYFFQNGFYRSIVQTLAILLVIYQRTQNSEKVLEISKGLLGNKGVYEKLPRDVQAYTHYVVGLGYTLQYSLANAETQFEKARKIFKENYKQTIYLSNYVLTLSKLSMVQALQGKMDQALQLIGQIESLIQDEFIIENLEVTTKRQIKHSFNLIKFYVRTRKKDFNIEESSDLIKNLYSGTQANYSDAIMLSEFLLNAQLSYDQLLELQKKDNVSLKRIKHITSFMMEKTRTDVDLKTFERLRNRIVTLWKRRIPKDETFIEQSFVDLLLAQQYYDMGRFDEMNKLLKNYSDILDSIEVLEQRLFIKGLMHFAAHRSGDISAPFKFYETIKECKSNDFTSLEEQFQDISTVR